MAEQPDHRRGPIRSMYADDPEMADLVEAFVSEMPARVDALRAAYDHGQIQALTRLAHQLSGSSAGYGFPALGNAARALECRLRTLDEDTSRLEHLAREFEGLVELCARTAVDQPNP